MNDGKDLTTAAAAELPVAPPPLCLNCGAFVGGRFCQACGQRHDPHVHTVGHFLSEATEDLTHADSRLWSTLFALLCKPGYLTREFFAGRRPLSPAGATLPGC